ncbi:MAG: mechanosensitive ion channel family protein [Microthrixaceae bacterium]
MLTIAAPHPGVLQAGDGSGVQAEDVVQGIEGCGPGDRVCNWVRDVTGSDTAADVSDFLVDNVATILLIILVAAAASWVLRRVIRRSMERLFQRAHAMRLDQRPPAQTARERLEAEQRDLRVRKRTETLGGVLVLVGRVFIWSVALILVLGELGLDLAPLIAGAGVIGVALGFGAQKVVGDFLSGMFMIAEDQFGVGDIVDLGEATGTVERITLRTTVLMDIYGTVWHVPNGEVQRVGNLSQEWSAALLDVGVAYGSDTDAASEVLLRTATEMSEDPEFSDAFLDDPEVLGVQTLAADAVTIRVSVRTRPAEQFRVQRELNRRFKRALEEAGIEIPFPQRTVWVRNDEPGIGTGQPSDGHDSPARDDVTGDS